MSKLNCWGFIKCGREVGGKNVKELGICPASTIITLDGINSGKNGGRCCWAIKGTFCKESTNSTYAQLLKSNLKTCFCCDFFNLVYREEDKELKDIDDILKKLNKNE